MNVEELLYNISNLTVWKKNGQRAPHKPLLILFALGQYQNHKKLELPYEEVRDKLRNLLIEFGPPRKSYHPEEPFARLVGDGIWKLSAPVDLRKFNDKQLLASGVAGGFNQEVIHLLQNNPSLVPVMATKILEEHFPDTIHDDILKEVGLDLSLYKKKPRDPLFREKILRAYEYSCALCGFNVRLGKNLVAVEAAHIQWHQAGGPDNEDNGIALCSLHHKLFDRGVFTVSKERKMLVSEEAHGTNGFEEWLMRYHGQTLRSPIRPEYSPKDLFLQWHVREVFRGKTRYTYS
jgi:putative restriction endonuclease